MATSKVPRTLVELFDYINDRLRRLELKVTRYGHWYWVEDQGTGVLTAVRDNGMATPATIVPVASPTGGLIVGDYTISQVGVNLVATNNITTTQTVLAIP